MVYSVTIYNQKHFVKFVVYFSNQKYSHNRREKLSHKWEILKL